MLVKYTKNLFHFSKLYKQVCGCHTILQTKTDINYENEVNFEPQDKLQQRTIKVAVIGTPNSGKSTFINSLVEHQICPTSKKVHTTRNLARAFTIEQNTQIIFLDTPGLVSYKEIKRHQLEKSFTKDTASSIQEADIIGVLHDASNPWTRDRLNPKVLRLLQKHNDLPSFLVLNKIDLLKSKRKLLDLTRHLTGNCLNGQHVETSENEHEIWKKFSQIFMVSSLMGDGIQEVKDYLVFLARPTPWVFESGQCTDQAQETVIVNTVKATLLDFLPQEIPYNLRTQLEYFESHEDGSVTAMVLVTCPTARIEKLIAGVGDGKLKQITAVAQRALWKAFHCPVTLNITTFAK